MNAAPPGAALGETACHAGEAIRELVLTALCIDAADLPVPEQLASAIEAAADLYGDLVHGADDIGHAEVARRRAAE